MFDHVLVDVGDLDASKVFYAASLSELGISLQEEFGNTMAGFGPDSAGFWLAARGRTPSGVHLAFPAPSREAVDAFYEAALGSGGKDNGAPGLRSDYGEDYYAAFVLDPDGNNIEAVHKGS
jgi:catechol 2,3-dioxygenase-like lactoylglutathione lyase family enzyme